MHRAKFIILISIQFFLFKKKIIISINVVWNETALKKPVSVERFIKTTSMRVVQLY